jgi:hypothetical protein
MRQRASPHVRRARRASAARLMAVLVGASVMCSAAAQQVPRVVVVNLLEPQPRTSEVGATVFSDRSSTVASNRLIGAEIGAAVRAEIERAGARVVESTPDSQAIERLRDREFIAGNNARKLHRNAGRWLPRIFGADADFLVILQHMPKRSGLLGGSGPTGFGLLRRKGMPGVPDEAYLYLSYGVSVVRRSPLELVSNSPASILLVSPSTAGIDAGQEPLDADAIERMSDVLVKAAIYCAGHGLGAAGFWRTALPSCESRAGVAALSEHLLSGGGAKAPWE